MTETAAAPDNGGELQAMRDRAERADARILELEANRELFQKQRDEIVSDRDRIVTQMKDAVDNMAVTATVEATSFGPGDLVLIRIKEAKTPEALDALKRALSWIVRRYPKNTFAVIAPEMQFSIEKMSETELRKFGLISSSIAEAGIPALEAAYAAYRVALMKAIAILQAAGAELNPEGKPELVKLSEDLKTYDKVIAELLKSELTNPLPGTLQEALLEVGRHRDALQAIRDSGVGQIVTEDREEYNCSECEKMRDLATAELRRVALKQEGHGS